MSLVLIVFGCIVCSFTLSNLIKKQPTTNGIPNSWMGLLSGNKKICLFVFLKFLFSTYLVIFFVGSVNLNHVASTTVNQNGIIQPSIIYKQHKSGNIHEEKITDEAIDIQISTIEEESSRYIVEFYFIF